MERPHRYFIVYAIADEGGSLSVRNGIVRAGAPLDRIESIEQLEQELSKEAKAGGYARLVHFIPLGEDATNQSKP